jgi:BirA family biotin operon repressor/biotin-[acetyl-CoA-carboxylase] ligase
MKEKIIENNIIHFDKIDSTNSYAKQILNKNPPGGTIILSDIQTQGRGRKNRKWSSPKGGLWFSIILCPDIVPEKGMLVTMTVSIAIAQAIEELINICPTIKWPNDLLINGKKVCGILTEFDLIENINYCIVGIGINVNNKVDPNLKDTAISLCQVYESKIDLEDFLQLILKKINENYKKLYLRKYYDLRELWLKYSKIVGKKIKVINKKILIGNVIDIDENGNLILSIKGKNEIISNGDIYFL